MVYCYCRISRAKQSIERQIRNIKAIYPEAVVVQEVFTRTSLNRKGWQKLFKNVRVGDTIVFDSVSRMSGNASEGFDAYEALYNRGVNLIFLKEPHINTDTYRKALENNVQLTGCSVDYIIEGVNKYLMALAKEQIRKYNRDFGGQLTNQETWELIGISKMTFYKYKKEIQEEATC